MKEVPDSSQIFFYKHEKVFREDELKWINCEKPSELRTLLRLIVEGGLGVGVWLKCNRGGGLIYQDLIKWFGGVYVILLS